MKNILILITIIFLLTNCNNPQTKETDRVELIPEPDRHDRLLGEAIQKLRKLHCDFSVPDTSLCGIILRNSKSTDNIIGTGSQIDEKEQYHFYSLMDRETLTLTQHSGDAKNEISTFNVTYSNKADYGYKQLNIDTFKTEKGIKLGMTKQEIINRLGSCYVTVDSTKDLIELYYRIENPEDSKTGVLKNNNMPIYYATYILWKDRLNQFEFGFEHH